MVKAVLLTDGNRLGIRISGHANSAKYSQDLICAAVSGMAQLAEMGIAGKLGLKKK